MGEPRQAFHTCWNLVLYSMVELIERYYKRYLQIIGSGKALWICQRRMGCKWWGMPHLWRPNWKHGNWSPIPERYFQCSATHRMALWFIRAFKCYESDIPANGLWIIVLWSNDRCWKRVENSKLNYELYLVTSIRRS